jgi:hypothetical protein
MHRGGNHGFTFTHMIPPPNPRPPAYHRAPNSALGAASHSPAIQLGGIKIPEGVTMSNLDNALRELREKRSHAQIEIEKLDQIISGIESLRVSSAVPSKSGQPKRVISAASRRKMALAQKARWASIRKKSRPTLVAKSGSAPAKRTMSASARRKIAAAQRARWAKVRAGKKAA